MTESYDSVRTENSNGIGRVYVDRPEKMNAVNTAVVAEIAAAIGAFQGDDDVGAIVLTGTGEKAFIGGGDITEFEDMTGLEWKTEFRAAMADLEAVTEGGGTPVIAAVNGVALGGGTEIAMMCDVILAAESATLGLPESTLGLIPGAGGTQRLAHLVGYLKAKELVLTGRHVPADEALEIGLVNEVVPDDEFDARVAELAETLERGSATAQAFAKEAINRTRGDLEAGLKAEEGLAALAFETDDKEEGHAAFLDKRDPEFGG